MGFSLMIDSLSKSEGLTQSEAFAKDIATTIQSQNHPNKKSEI